MIQPCWAAMRTRRGGGRGSRHLDRHVQNGLCELLMGMREAIALPLQALERASQSIFLIQVCGARLPGLLPQPAHLGYRPLAPAGTPLQIRWGL